MLNAEHYFATARERYRIKQRRDAERPKPWTTDPIFRDWRFCNVHREDDKTTVWFANNVRNALSNDKQHVVKATVIFRWFNRIETAEKIKDLLVGEWNTEEARHRLRGVSPVVTGAYIIKGADGFNKLDGVLHCIDLAMPKLEEMVPHWGQSLQMAWEDLTRVHYLGRFMAYEIVSDLRWTPVLDQAEDIQTWANAGPGCTRGLGYVLANDPKHFHAQSDAQQRAMLDQMTHLHDLSTNTGYWPPDWKRWEMREVEHWLCEYAKYRNAQSGLKLKRRFS